MVVACLANASGLKAVAVCNFDTQVSAYANDKMTCSGGQGEKASMIDMYSMGWILKSTFNYKEEAYLVFEKDVKAVNAGATAKKLGASIGSDITQANK
jgi:DhnA family fructose-bisphosphate aldolase class Ia